MLSEIFLCLRSQLIDLAGLETGVEPFADGFSARHQPAAVDPDDRNRPGLRIRFQPLEERQRPRQRRVKKHQPWPSTLDPIERSRCVAFVGPWNANEQLNRETEHILNVRIVLHDQDRVIHTPPHHRTVHRILGASDVWFNSLFDVARLAKMVMVRYARDTRGVADQGQILGRRLMTCPSLAAWISATHQQGKSVALAWQVCGSSSPDGWPSIPRGRFDVE